MRYLAGSFRPKTGSLCFILFVLLALAPAAAGAAAAKASARRTRPPRAGKVVVQPTPDPAEPFSGEVPFLKPIKDPIEPFNRVMFSINNGLIDVLLNPVTAGWRAIAPQPVRTSVQKAGNNMAYPVRLINTLAQGKGKGALSETGRFLINSTVGLLGFFDPATHMGLKAYEEDFGQTFGFYGSGPGFYLVIPFLGPGSGRDYLGWLFDTILNPATYAAGAGTVFSLNRMSFSLPGFLHLREVEHDPYVLVRDMEALRRKKDVIDYAVNVSDIDPDPTLKWVFLKPHDPDFGKKAKDYKAVMTATGKKLTYSAWLHPVPAPLVFVLGGTGGHRMTDATLMLAEMLFKERFSVVSVSSSMNWEFMENAATAAVPGYPPQDAEDVYNALDSIHHDLKRRFPGRFNRAKALLGFSLGGLHAMYISQFADKTPPGSLHFDRYIAIDTPVDLLYALQNLDQYYNAPLQWRPEERERNVENTMLKALALVGGGQISPDTELPFNAIESRYLIGLTFKLALRDALYTSQKRDSLHVLQAPLGVLRRQPVYDEIVKYSFMDYVNVFIVPYYLNHPNFRIPREEMVRNSSLRSIEASLRDNPRIRAFNDQNDFFLRPEDLAWYRKTLGDRLTVFSKGGHMGNLYLPEIQSQIMDAIEDIKDIRPE